MTSDPRLEARYYVIKKCDLVGAQEFDLRKAMLRLAVPTRQCIVVEPDWACYEAVVALVLEESNVRAT